MRVPAFLLGLTALLPPAPAQDPTTAASITEAWRGLSRVFDLALVPTKDAQAAERTAFLLLDATPSLTKIGFPDALAQALDKNAAALSKTKIGVARVGVEKPLLAPTDDRQALLAAVRQALEAPSDKIQNVYADLRNLAGLLAQRPGARAILLATLENGDAEDDLEATVARLEQVHVQVFSIASEAYVADSYWAERAWERSPRGTKLTGGDAAHIDLPWGWVFQITVANEVSPSGSACYGLNRIAAETGGKVFLYSPPEATAHRCAIYGGCLFCNGDHNPDSEIYWKASMQPFAASTKPRAAVAADLASDPCSRATANAWRAALSAGLVRSQPPRSGATGGAAASASGAGDRLGLMLSLGFDRNAERADAAAKEAEHILQALDAELARVDPVKSNARQRAIAEHTRLSLQLAKVNLITYAGWCREIAPGLVAKDPPATEPPELPPFEREQRAVGIAITNYCLCHGAKPFLDVELPGGPRLREELGKLDALVAKYTDTYTHTPFVVALHRQGIARFMLTYPGVATTIERERPKSKSPTDPTTPGGGARPPRTGPTGSGGTGGPVTGGGK